MYVFAFGFLRVSAERNMKSETRHLACDRRLLGRRSLLAAPLVLSFGAQALGGEKASSFQRLFQIERSTNRNLVAYDLKLTAQGRPDPTEPVVAYWLMNAERGQREELSWLERRLAYGHELASEVSRDGFWMRLKASEDRPIRVVQNDGVFCAIMQLSGVRCALGRMYVKTDEHSTFPKVLYVDLSGRDLATGRPVVERIKP